MEYRNTLDTPTIIDPFLTHADRCHAFNDFLNNTRGAQNSCTDPITDISNIIFI